MRGRLILLAALWSVFGVLAVLIIRGDGPSRLDGAISRYVLEHRQPWLTTTMGAVTQLGSLVVLVPLLLALGVWVGSTYRTWRPLMFLTAAVGGVALLNACTKLLVARPRPGSGALLDVEGYGFPSGHSAQAAAGWLAVATLLGGLSRDPTRRVALTAGAVVVILGVGFSRVYLGVHAPTDVLGGWLLGVAWLGAVLFGCDFVRVGRGGRGP
jgi:undecaprenyl-diphosphatase